MTSRVNLGMGSVLLGLTRSRVWTGFIRAAQAEQLAQIAALHAERVEVHGHRPG